MFNIFKKVNVKEHDCFESIKYNENSQGSGYPDYLICEICGEVFQQHRYICWVRPYPHISKKIIDYILNKILCFDFSNDVYGEVNIPYQIIRKFPDLYGENSISLESKGSYYYEFSDNETYELLENKLEKLKNYCVGWCQFN